MYVYIGLYLFNHAHYMLIASYDWLISESSGAASDYIRDLMDFLRCTFLSFTNLPVSILRVMLLLIYRDELYIFIFCNNND